MDKIALKKKRLQRRRYSVKRKIKGKTDRLRLCISRSNRHFYAQIIDDSKGHTLVSASTVEKEFQGSATKGNKESAKEVGKLIAERAVKKDIKSVVFDRNGFLYHGKVKEFADAARENGLEF